MSLLNLSIFREDPSRIFKVWEGGLVFYGGFLLAVTAADRVHEVASVAHLEDGRPLHSVDCPGPFFREDRLFYGRVLLWKETSLPWAVTFSDPHSLARLHVPLHPTQLYEAGSGLALFFFLIWMEKRKVLRRPDLLALSPSLFHCPFPDRIGEG